ncbi:MAG: GyrI-like domain-containing protein [Anaerolineaceae bacterium]
MDVLDLKKDLARYYKPPAKQVELVTIPELTFAAVNGVIEPGCAPSTSQTFKEAVQALYSVSYALKFALKKRPVDPVDYPVMSLEALWWVETGEFDIRTPTNWHWTAMIVQPDLVHEALFSETVETLKKKKPNPALDKMNLKRFGEGLCIQMMHIGPYSRELETLAVMEAFLKKNGYHYRGKHHEIYLGDPNKTAPERLKTVLRHPVEKVHNPLL